MSWYFLFPQQGRDSTCQCMPSINLAILHKLRSMPGGLLTSMLDARNWHTIETWLAKTFKASAAWQIAMEELTNPKGEFGSKFSAFQYELANRGVHLEHMYTKSGKKYYLSSLNPLKNLQKYWLAPYNFASAKEHPKVLQKTLPLYYDGKNDYIFNPNNLYFEKLHATIHAPNKNSIYLPASKKFYQLTDEQASLLNLPQQAEIGVTKLHNSLHGFKCGYSYRYLPAQADDNIYFHVGLFQFMLFAMGVDRNLNIIDSQHQEFAVQQELLTAMAKTPSNPWALPEFCKENFFEYHLALLFQQDSALKAEVKATLQCFFNTWSHYEELDNLYDSDDLNNRQSLKTRKHYLPCEELILAYSFSQSLRIVWASSISNQALYAVLEVPKVILPLTYLPGFTSANKILKLINKPMQVSKNYYASFMSSWDKIKAKLHSTIKNRDFMSFDGHGVIISFAKDIINLQQTAHPANKTMHQLGFAIIDSLYADATKPFYRLDQRVYQKIGYSTQYNNINNIILSHS